MEASALRYGDFLGAFPRDPSLFGGGELLAPVFGRMVSGGVGRALEWCCGQAHIGLWLLALGRVETMTFVDINPAAIRSAVRSAEALGFIDRAAFYCTDNLAGVPIFNGFDLVVGNPPSYCNIQRSHPLGHLRYDPRPSDLGWRLHHRFYREIPRFLPRGAEIMIAEVDPWAETVILPDGEWDRRPEPPIDTFRAMIEGAGMTWLGCDRFSLLDGMPGMGMIRAQADDPSTTFRHQPLSAAADHGNLQP